MSLPPPHNCLKFMTNIWVLPSWIYFILLYLILYGARKMGSSTKENRKVSIPIPEDHQLLGMRGSKFEFLNVADVAWAHFYSLVISIVWYYSGLFNKRTFWGLFLGVIWECAIHYVWMSRVHFLLPSGKLHHTPFYADRTYAECSHARGKLHRMDCCFLSEDRIFIRLFKKSNVFLCEFNHSYVC